MKVHHSEQQTAHRRIRRRVQKSRSTNSEHNVETPQKKVHPSRHETAPCATKIGRDIGTAMPPPPAVRSIKARTYLQVELGLLRRRYALLVAVQNARQELDRISQSQMPPLLRTMRRDNDCKLQVRAPSYAFLPSSMGHFPV